MPLRPIPRPKVLRVGRPAGKFTQHRRLDLLREKLEIHAPGLMLEDLASLLHVSTRSVRRYLRELQLITDLESVETTPGGPHLWRIKPSERGRAVALRRTQAYALLAARRVFDVLKGSALYDEIDLALRQIEQIAHRPAARVTLKGEAPSDARLEDRFAYVPPPARAYGNRSEEIDEVFQAVAEQRVLRFRHRDGTRGAAEGRGARVTLHPWALVLHDGAIACLGHDVDRGQARAFPLDRMSDVSASEAERFEVPADFDLAQWLHGAFGIARAVRNVRIAVEFDARVADVVRAQRVHPSQKVALAPDGRVRVVLSLPEAPELLAAVRRWVLGFGAVARVVEPKALAEEIAAELRRAAERYG
jgi:predicted DNA-binding transcriptional regulator YafY